MLVILDILNIHVHIFFNILIELPVSRVLAGRLKDAMVLNTDRLRIAIASPFL